MKYKIPKKAAKTPVPSFPFPDSDFKTLDTLIDMTISDSDNEEYETHIGHKNDVRSDEEYCSFFPRLQIKDDDEEDRYFLWKVAKSKFFIGSRKAEKFFIVEDFHLNKIFIWTDKEIEGFRSNAKFIHSNMYTSKFLLVNTLEAMDLLEDRDCSEFC